MIRGIAGGPSLPSFSNDLRADCSSASPAA
jgi:hypothetical protein